VVESKVGAAKTSEVVESFVNKPQRLVRDDVGHGKSRLAQSQVREVGLEITWAVGVGWSGVEWGGVGWGEVVVYIE
jgi:hypothetical protein